MTSRKTPLDSVAAKLADLARRGRAVLGAAHDPGLYGPRPGVLHDGASQELLDGERGNQ